MNYRNVLRNKGGFAVVGITLLLVLTVVTYVKAGTGTAGVPVAQETKDTTVDPNECKRQQDEIKNWSRNISDKQREVQNVKKEIKTGLDTSKVDQYISDFTTCVAKLSPCTPDFWTYANVCNEYTRDIEIEFQDNIWPLRDCYNNKRSIEDRRKERKNLEGQVKDILRNNKSADVSALTAITAQIDGLLAKAATAGCSGTDIDTLKDISGDFNGLFQDFYTLSNDVRQTAEAGRRLEEDKKDFEKNIKKQCSKDKSREFKNLEKQLAKSQKSGTVPADTQSAYDEIKASYNYSCVTLIQKMQDAINASDTDTFEEARQEYNDDNQAFWDKLNEVRQGLQEQEQKANTIKNVTRDLKQKQVDLKRMRTALQRIEKSYNKVAAKYLDKEERKQSLVDLKGYITRANELVTSISEGLTSADTAVKNGDFDTLDEYWMNQQDLDDMRTEFDDLQRTSQFIPELIKQAGNVEKGIKNASKERIGLPDELKPQFDEFISGVKKSLDNAWTLMISDPQSASEELQSINDLNQDWGETKKDWEDQKNEAEGQ